MKRTLYKLIFIVSYPVADFMLIAFSIMLSYKVYRITGIGQHVYYHKIHIIPLSLLAAALTVLFMMAFGTYKKESSLLNVEEIKNVTKGITFSFFTFGIILFFSKLYISRYILVFSYFFSMIFVISIKTALYHNFALTQRLKGFHKKILIYGAGELGQALFREIANSPKLRILPKGFIDDDPNKANLVCYQNGFNSSEGIRVVGTQNDIERLKKELDIDEIYVAISNIYNENLIKILDQLAEQNIKASFVPNLYKAFVPNMKITTIGGIPLVKEENSFNTVYLYFKRFMDIFLTLILSILLWPLILIIMLAIKLNSKGPAIFIQNRVGKDGKIFKLYKFRTMYADTDPYAVNPIDLNDARITKVGRFLRKTSLDELPQAINVLKGDMSLVGPRPEMPFIVEQYNDIHKERLKVLPGITGFWQLSGDRKKAIHENLDYDLYYIHNLSFLLDLVLLIETSFYAFKGI